MNKFRIEKDTMGEIKVEAHSLWGAQTQRSIENFRIGEKMPLEIIYSYAILKKACAQANFDLGELAQEKANLISTICDEITQGAHNEQFPLVVWQTGSGTQTNMNLNEVISNRAHVLSGGNLEDDFRLLHPNDDVNKSQSSNDTFPSAIHIAVLDILIQETFPTIEKLAKEFENKATENQQYVKIARTHMMDATPINFEHVFGVYAKQLKDSYKNLRTVANDLRTIPIGGTAIGTGLNAPKYFSKTVCQYLELYTKYKFEEAENKFESISSHDILVRVHSALKNLAITMFKILNDLKLMASGPRCGLSEIILPANEPGSSIMPGKVNPTQIEAFLMVCAQIIGNDTAINLGGMNGQFELNAYKPLIMINLINSAKLFNQAANSFTENCLVGIQINTSQTKQNLENSLMNITALLPLIGYTNAAKIADFAHNNNVSLRDAVISTGLIEIEEFEKVIAKNSNF